MAGNGGIVGSLTYNTARFTDMCKTTSGTLTSTGSDITISIPFDWSNGTLEIIRSLSSSKYLEDGFNNVSLIKTTYDALTNSNYTSDQLLEILSSSSPIIDDKTANLAAVPKSATTSTIVLNGVSGTNVYVKYFVSAPYTQDVTMSNLQAGDVLLTTTNQTKSGVLTLSAPACGLVVTNDALIQGSLTVGTSGIKFPDNLTQQNAITFRDGVANAVGATGGTITVAGGYTIHTFTSNGTFTVTSPGNVDILIVGGGGGSGNGTYHGGGGGGGYLEQTGRSLASGAYSVVIGAGGGYGSDGGRGGNGEDSSFDGCIAIGGGGGGKYTVVEAGKNGGSGGGGSSNSGAAGSATQGNSNGATGYGNNGGAGNPTGGGGGGGAGGPGTTGGGAGTGGPGKSSSISGTAVTYAAGGRGIAGSGDSSAGAANTGNGGGDGAGGSGIVIIRYANTGPTSTPLYIGQTFLNIATKREYRAYGTSSSADWIKVPAFYSTTFTITGGGGDATINIPFDWSGGWIRVIRSASASNYFDNNGTSAAVAINETSYDAITNSSYTDHQILQIVGDDDINSGCLVVNKTLDQRGIPKSATPFTVTFDDDGTTVYAKIFIWA